MYCFSTPYAKKPPHGPQLANVLYQPSYLIEHWALSWYGIIPEKVGLYTSITPRYTSTFSNTIGAFRYRSVRQQLFTGYEQIDLAGTTVLIAQPEKALLDLWYLESGLWSVERMESWRFDPALIQCNRLEQTCKLYAAGQTAAAWRSLIMQNLQTLDWTAVIRDVQPFLEQPGDIHQMSKPLLGQLLAREP